MSFLTNKTGMGVSQAAGQAGGGEPVQPAFKPQIARSLRMHPQLAAGVAAIVFVALVGYALTRKPVYTAESLVHAEPAVAKVMSDGTTSAALDFNGYDAYLQQQMLLVVRPDVLAAAVAKLSPDVWRTLGPTERAAAASLAGQLKIGRVNTSYQISITLQSRNPVAAAAIVNAATAAYLEAVHKDSAALTDQRAQLLAEERRRIEGEMETTRQEQAGLSAALGVASTVGESGNPYDFEIASVRGQLLTAREAHDVSAAQLASLSGEGVSRNTALTAAADDLIAGDAGLSSMRSSVGARRSMLTGQMAGMKPDNPVYKQDLDELTDLDKTLDTMTTQLRGKAERQLQQKLRTDLERTGDVEGRLNAQLARLTANATTAAPKLQRATELSSDLQRLNTRYAAVDDALRSLQLEANGPGVVRLSLAAAVPASPDPSKKMVVIGAAPLLALLFGITAAVLARKRDHRIYSGRDIEDLLGFAPIAILPARADVSARVLDEYVLRLAAGIEGAYRASGAQTFLLTAVSASTEIRSLRKALTGRLERIGLDVAVARTTDLLVAGPEMTEDPRRELAKSGDAAGEGFVSLHLAKLKGAHALVVIDAPALGTSAETEYVARCADATVLIAECGVTTREELLEAAQLLQRLSAKGVGTVLQELHLRYADESFRQAIDAFEQRQSEPVYLSGQRDAVYPVARVEEAVMPAVVEPVEVVEAAPIAIEAPVVAAEAVADAPVIVETAARSEQPEEELVAAEPAAYRHRGIHEMPRKVEVVTRVAGATALAPVEYEISDRNPAAHEKIAPTLSALREQSPAGETPMSGSKSWFHRFLHRDEEKVSILPDNDDEDEAIDGAAFLESRISRSVQAYGAPLNRSEVEPMAEAKADTQPEARLEDKVEENREEMSFSRRFVLESPHEPEVAAAPMPAVYEEYAPNAVPVAEHAVEAAPLPVLGHIEHYAHEDYFDQGHSDEFVVPQELMAPWAAKPVEASVDVAPAVEVAPVETAHSDVMSAPEEVIAQPAVAEVQEPVSEPVAEPVQRERVRPARPLSFHQLAGENAAKPSHEEPKPEAAHSADVEVPTVIEPFAESYGHMEEAAFEEAQQFAEHVEPEVVKAAEIDETHEPKRDPYAPPAGDPYAPPAGTSRWDPIPPLRPSDSGWNRIHGVTGVVPKPAEPLRHNEDWTWTSRANEEVESPRWAEAAPVEEFDEPQLSRPWGLLSRFQQTNQITPARKVRSGDETERDSRGPFQNDRRS